MKKKFLFIAAIAVGLASFSFITKESSTTEKPTAKVEYKIVTIVESIVPNGFRTFSNDFSK